MLRAVFALVAVCAGLSFVAAQPPKPAVTMDDIKKAWQERQDKVKTLKMSWKQELTYPKGSLTLALQGAGFNIHGTEPPHDLVIKGDASIAIIGESYRWDVDRKSWNGETHQLDPFAYSIVFDGKQHMQYMRAISGKPYSTLAISNASPLGAEFQSIELLPLVWAVRGLDRRFSGGILDEFEVTGRYIQISGQSCVELKNVARQSGQVSMLYIDTKRSCVPVRYLVTSDLSKSQHLQLDIEYEKDTFLGWRPSKWHQVVRNPISRESISNVISQCVVNDGISSSILDPQPPPGTLIIDETQPQTTRTVVLDGGSKGQPVRDAIRYSDIVLRAKPTAAPWRWSWYIGASLCVVAIIAIVVLRRKRRPT